MLKKILENEKHNGPDKSINTIMGYPTAKEMIKSLYDEIFERRYDESDSFEFDYQKGEYVFFCDVRTYEHSTRVELSCPLLFYQGDEIAPPAGIIYELEYELKKII